MSEIIRIRDRAYILATSALAEEQTRVLKHGETFAVFGRFGDVRFLGAGEQGIYHEGTRHLSRSVLRLGEDRPLLLSSTVTEDNVLLAVDLTNPDVSLDDEVVVPTGTLHLFRSKFLWGQTCYERIRMFNHGAEALGVELTVEFDADFADIFEVRGAVRDRRGSMLEPEVGERTIVLGYEGLDGVVRRTRIEGGEGWLASGQTLRFGAELGPRAGTSVYTTLTCEIEEGPARVLAYDAAMTERRQDHDTVTLQECVIETSNEQFNDWLQRSYADLRMMITETSDGPYPYAGVPWFSTPFGRDALITAYEMLWVDPSVAHGVLRFLAATQARDTDPDREAEPGKILHEHRRGEMAALGEVPFGHYYGSADATPLFVILAGSYHTATGDIDTVKDIWPNIEAAIDWIDRYGDVDGDGFVEYVGHSPRGLVQQGWKDSSDSIFHDSGELAHGPIALCEVQGYVHAAKRKAARLALALGERERAERWLAEARDVQARFEDAFWCDDLGTYALALDGDKRPCRVRTSNAGHCLLAGIASPERAIAVAHGLLSEDMFSGWGIRTLAAREVRYRPISYHNGSVWPHDNALIAQGLARYGLKGEVLRILTGLFDASILFELHRLPELFSGFPRRPGEGPTAYPSACAPQSWASATVFLLLRACLGLSVDAVEGHVRLVYPALPPSLREVRITGLRVGDGSLDLVVHRYEDDVGINIVRREGDIEVLTVK